MNIKNIVSIAVVSSAIVFSGAAIVTPVANAAPGQCGQGYAMGSGGGFCDGPPRPDGTWYHCESVYVLGIGGTNCFNVRPVPLDIDPRGWVPA